MLQPRRRLVWELDWNLLRTFTVIVQEGSLTAAAEKLLLRQPTISNALKRLETHLCCRLIERQSSYFEVTAAGQRLYGEAVAMFDMVSGLHALSDERPDEIVGHIDMAFASHVVCPFLDKVLADFHRMYPRITFSTSVSSSQEVIWSVLRQDACLGICLMHERHPKLQYTVLYDESFGYFCGPQHRLYGRSGITLAELRKEPYVSFKTDQMSGALWPVALLRQQEKMEGQVIGTSSHLEEVKRLIVNGFGFGPLPIHVVQDDVEAGRLWRLPPYEQPPSISVYLVLDPAARRSKAEALFLNHLRSEMESTSAPERMRAHSALLLPDIDGPVQDI